MATFSTNSKSETITNNESLTTGGFGDSKTPELLEDIPFSLFSKVNNLTYSEKFFGVQHNENVDFLENYIITQIQEKNLQDSVSSYEEIINQLLTKIGIYDNEIGESKVERIVKYVKMLGRNITQKQKKVNIINKQQEVNKLREVMKQKLLVVKGNKELQERLTNQEKYVNRLKTINKNTKDRLSQEQQEKDTIINSFKEESKNLSQEIINLKSNLENKNKEINSLNNEINKFNSELNNKENQVQDLNRNFTEEKSNLFKEKIELNNKIKEFEVREKKLKLKLQGLI